MLTTKEAQIIRKSLFNEDEVSDRIFDEEEGRELFLYFEKKLANLRKKNWELKVKLKDYKSWCNQRPSGNMVIQLKGIK